MVLASVFHQMSSLNNYPHVVNGKVQYMLVMPHQHNHDNSQINSIGLIYVGVNITTSNCVLSVINGR
eukprot:UN08421